MSYSDLQSKVYSVFDRSVTFFYHEDHRGGKIDVSQWEQVDIDKLLAKLTAHRFVFDYVGEFVYLICD